jgi:hypothetical protein
MKTVLKSGDKKRKILNEGTHFFAQTYYFKNA